MTTIKIELIDYSLYLVLDPGLCGRAQGMVSTALAAVRGGCTIVQLRAPAWMKREMAECGRALLRALSPYHVPLIVDDHIDVAMAIGAQGVHVGQKDLQPDVARRLMGPEALIGYSVSDAAQLEAARALVDSGDVDYFGTGPIASTATKPDAAAPLGIKGFAKLAADSPAPMIAIGSVKAENAAALAHAGAAGVAVVSAICGQKDPEAEARRLLAEVERGRLARFERRPL